MTMGCEEPAPPIIWALITFEMEKVVNMFKVVNLFEDDRRVSQKCVFAPEAVAHSAV